MSHTRDVHTDSTGDLDTHGEHDAHLDLTRRELVAGAVGVGILAACSDDPLVVEPVSLEAKGPYPTWNDTIRGTYSRTLPNGTTGQYAVTYVGDKALPTGTFRRYRGAREGATSGAELWVQPQDRRFVLGGAEYSSQSAALLKVPSPATITLDTPLVIDLDAPVGVAQPLEAKAKVAISGSNVTSASAKGSYTVVGRDVAVEAPSGVMVAGCTHLKLDAEVPIFFGATSVSASAQVFYSSTLGVVKTVLDEPFSGLGWGVKGSRTSHELRDGYFSVEAMEVVGKGSQSTFQLSTKEAQGKLDADKDTHAKMLVEMRWVDEVAAKTEARPNVQPAFGTNTGTYSATLTQAPVSFLHPEENGKGYVYWYYYVDQAAKNQATNGIEYRAGVSSASGNALRVTSRIVYKRL